MKRIGLGISVTLVLLALAEHSALAYTTVPSSATPASAGYGWWNNQFGNIYAKGVVDTCFIDQGDSSIQFQGVSSLGSTCPTYVSGVGAGWVMPLHSARTSDSNPNPSNIAGSIWGRYDVGGCGVMRVSMWVYDPRGVFYDSAADYCSGGVLTYANNLGSGYFSDTLNTLMYDGGHAYLYAWMSSAASYPRQALISQYQWVMWY